MCKRCEELEKELADLQLEVDDLLASLAPKKTPIPLNLRLSPKEEDVMRLFIENDIMPRKAIELLLLDDQKISRNYAYNFIQRLNLKLFPHGLKVLSHWGRGWYLTAKDKETIGEMVKLWGHN